MVIQKILEIRGPTTKQFIREVGRVTERLVSNKGQCVACIGCIEESNCKVECGAIDDCLNKLAEYETAEEEGRLVILPCRIGDTVYIIADDCDYPYGCHTKLSCKKCEYRNLHVYEDEFGLVDIVTNIRLFGNTIFFTREEAEKALDQIEGDK